MNEFGDIRENMRNWVDFDVALFEVARALGLVSKNSPVSVDVKVMLWSDNAINRCLSKIVKDLVDLGYFEYDSESERFRVSSKYNVGSIDLR